MNKHLENKVSFFILALVLLSCYLVYTLNEKKAEDTVVSIVEESSVAESVSDTKSLEPRILFRVNNDIPLTHTQQVALQEICAKENVPYPLALGVIEKESNFDPLAYNDRCWGLMQVSEIHATSEELKHPVTNMTYGVKLLSNLYSKYGDWNKTLVAYNCGSGGAEEYYFSRGYNSSSYSREVIVRSRKFADMLGVDF